MEKVPKLNINEVETQRETNRSVRHNGRTYFIKNTKSVEDVEDIYVIIDDLYEDARSMSFWADMKANIYKTIHVLSSIYIIISGAVVGVLGITSNTPVINNSTDTGVTYTSSMLAIIILGFSVTCLKSIIEVFSIHKKSIILKESGIKLRKIARDVKNLKNLDLNNQDLLRKIDEYYTEIDELDIIMFNNEDKPEKNKTDTVVNIQ